MVNIVYVAVNLAMGIVNLVIVDVLRIDKVNKVVNKVKIVTVEVAVNIVLDQDQIVAVAVAIGNHHD
jgi:hypothetical protein